MGEIASEKKKLIEIDKKKALAKKNYEDTLKALKREPANANLRQKALELGRAYSNLMRDQKGNTIFDEVALMNDINAACAATHQLIQNRNLAHMQGSIEERLKNLLSLREKGLIDEADFIQRKKEIIETI
jgi:hypothetical protein